MSLSYITRDEIQNLTGTKLEFPVVDAIGEQAEREATGYLQAKGVTSISGNIVKSACLKLAHAGVLARYMAEGIRTIDDGAGTNTATYQDYQQDSMQFISMIRKEAFNLLDNYAGTQAVSSNNIYVRAVHGR